MLKEKPIQKLIKSKNGILKGIRFFLGVALILGIGYVILNYVPFVAKYNYYVIQTGSMEPIIKTRDIVIVDSSIDTDSLEIGQIIAFNADINGDDNDEIVVHYLSSITEENGIRSYKTLPAVSDREDPWTLNDEDIIGLHRYTIENVGGFLMFAQSNIGKIILVADLLIIYFLIEMFSDSKKEKSPKNEILSQ